ncbi:MAG: CopD family copper resistance protein [Acetobacteraceae bacterium]
MNHFALLTIHLFAAIMFVGTVFFEVLILEPIRSSVGRDVMRAIERGIADRARRVMPFVMLALYGAGAAMAWQFRSALAHPWASSFALLLWIKILLALSVLAHFIVAMALSGTGKLKSRHFRLIHLSVFVHVVLIVFLAKAMFYVTW